jgi:hypothetical protein
VPQGLAVQHLQQVALLPQVVQVALLLLVHLYQQQVAVVVLQQVVRAVLQVVNFLVVQELLEMRVA